MTEPDAPSPPTAAAAAGAALTIPEQAADALIATRPWLLMVGGTTAVLLLVIFLGLVVAYLTAPKPLAVRLGASIGAAVGVLFYVPPMLSLYRSCAAIRQLAREGNSSHVVEALSHQHRFWRYLGILTLLSLGAYAILVFWIVAAGGLGL
jgi:hypothetical protein